MCLNDFNDFTPPARPSLRPIPTGFKTEAGEWSDEAKERFFGAKNEEARPRNLVARWVGSSVIHHHFRWYSWWWPVGGGDLIYPWNLRDCLPKIII